MRICIVDGRQIQDRERLHGFLAEQLEFPDWYGRNLDALYDCLADLTEETRIVIRRQKELEQHLGGYTVCFLKVLRDASLENPCIQVEEQADC